MLPLSDHGVFVVPRRCLRAQYASFTTVIHYPYNTITERERVHVYVTFRGYGVTTAIKTATVKRRPPGRHIQLGIIRSWTRALPCWCEAFISYSMSFLFTIVPKYNCNLSPLSDWWIINESGSVIIKAHLPSTRPSLPSLVE